MDIGVYLPQVGFTFADVLHRAQRCDELGIGSLWLYDHLYSPGIPTHPSLESWTLATALLARTQRLRVGHLVLSATFRHPALLAKMAATLDVVSDGRLDLGVGSGSYQQEHVEAGMAWGSGAERAERLGETLAILHQAFAGDRVDFEGTHYQLRGFPTLPRPVQSPRPPIVVGGVGEKRTLPLVARYADVWNVPTYGIGEIEAKWARLRALCDEIGRDPAEIRVSVEAVLALAPDEAALPGVTEVVRRRFDRPGYDLAHSGLIGTPSTVLWRLDEWRELGVDQVVFFTHDRASDTTLDLVAEALLPNV